VPLCMFTLIGMCAVCLLVHGDVANNKLLVHLESSIDVSSDVAVKLFGVQSKEPDNRATNNTYCCSSTALDVVLSMPVLSSIRVL
jgi:hypothetical protein